MTSPHHSLISQELKLQPFQVQATIELFDQGSTVPFVARYRKEKTGGLDEVELITIRDRIHQLRELDKRRETVLRSIDEQGKLTPELKEKVVNVKTMSQLEDLYLPYRPKKRTKATVAREKGLESFADLIFLQKGISVEKEALNYVGVDKGVLSTDDAISGARDIIAERVSEHAQAREHLRKLFRDEAFIRSKVLKGKEIEGSKYQDYFEYQELAKNAPSHRILAIRRGEKEGILLATFLPEQEKAISALEEIFIKGRGEDSMHVKTAIVDSYKRLLVVSLETEYRLELKKRADEEAINVFTNNLRELLMEAPLGQKRILAVDPGQRTGCKIVCLDNQGKLLINDVIYLFDSDTKKIEAREIILRLCEKFGVEIIAVGNGTACRETESFLRSLNFPKKIPVVVVSESGASVYSASDVAREEFPDFDITVRGAISIGRRLMDPLSELVKVDPKAIGVGQYQHDVDQTLLKNSLDDVVASCVNQVGVELNTSSKELLMYVSGMGPVRARSIIDFRNQNGPFCSRAELLKVPNLGPKAFEQAAGFLRIVNAENPLDTTGIHPESYAIVEKMASDNDCKLTDLINFPQYRMRIKPENYVSDAVGLPTLKDILKELEKPGRDPREAYQLFTFKEGVHTLDDLKLGMKLTGVVTNVTAFGVFVDIGVHCDGLVHISQLADRFVKDPHDVVKVHQKLDVTVLEVDKNRKRVALSAKRGRVS